MQNRSTYVKWKEILVMSAQRSGEQQGIKEPTHSHFLEVGVPHLSGICGVATGRAAAGIFRTDLFQALRQRNLTGV